MLQQVRMLEFEGTYALLGLRCNPGLPECILVVARLKGVVLNHDLPWTLTAVE